MNVSAAAWIAVAVMAQAGSMATFAHLQRQVLADAGLRLPLRSSLAIVYAGNAMSVTIPFAGTSASAAFTYRQYVRRGATGAMAGWAMAIAGVFSTVTFALLVGGGALANGNEVVAVAGILSVVAVVVPLAALVVALRRPAMRAQLERFVVGTLVVSKRIARHPRGEPGEIVSRGVEQLFGYRMRLRHGVAAAMFATLNWLLDSVCLWAVLRSFHVSLPLRDLPLVYAAAVAAASLGFTPAGIGTVEAAIALALAGFGAGSASALSAAVMYRGISTWLVLLIGWVVLVVMRRQPADAAAEPVPLHHGPTQPRVPALLRWPETPVVADAIAAHRRGRVRTAGGFIARARVGRRRSATRGRARVRAATPPTSPRP